MTRRSRLRDGFTLLELLVVIIIIMIVAATSIPAMIVFMKGRRLQNAGEMVRGACTKARARAIAKGDYHYLLIFTKDAPKGSPDSIKINDSNNSPVEFEGWKGQMMVVDSNRRGGNPAQELSKVDEAIRLPEHTEFYTGNVAAYGTGWDIPFYLQFNATGELINRSYRDTPSSNLKVTDPKSLTPFRDQYDLVVIHGEKNKFCFIDFIPNTGSVNFRVYPKE